MKEVYNYLYPIFAMVLLTLLVTGTMFKNRVKEIKERKLRLNVFKTSKDREALENISAADNFRNLFEMPVLFYLLISLLMITNQYRSLYLVMLWLYVGTRYIHSYIHCTYNHVYHRFVVFASSVFILFILWIIFFVDTILLEKSSL